MLRSYKLVMVCLLAACAAPSTNQAFIAPTAVTPNTQQRANPPIGAYVVDSGRISVYAIGSTKPVRTISSGLQGAYSVNFSPDGTLFVSNEHTVGVYAPGASTPVQVLSDSVRHPVGVAFDSAGNVYIANDVNGGLHTNSNVLVYHREASGYRLVRTIDDGLEHNSVGGLVVDNEGWLYAVVDAKIENNDSVIVYPPDSSVPSKTIVGFAYGLALDGNERLWEVRSSGATKRYRWGSLHIYSAHGATSQVFSTTEGVVLPEVVTVDASGVAFVGNYGASSISVYASDGSLRKRIRSHLQARFTAIATSSDVLFVANNPAQCPCQGKPSVFVFHADGSFWYEIPAKYPTSIAIGPI